MIILLRGGGRDHELYWQESILEQLRSMLDPLG
jgi:hypothetical protein